MFFLTWHFPNRYAWANEKSGNYYTTKYTDAWDVIQKTISKLPALEEKTIEFVKAFIETDIPDVVKESALFNISTLRTQTCFRTEDGNFYGWEGCMDTQGCCEGSCTHVCNLGYLVKPQNVKTTLRSIMKYNYRESMFKHFNKMRSYALGNEPVLLMASYPKERPEVPFPYYSEALT